jgi:hypothetical protein
MLAILGHLLTCSRDSKHVAHLLPERPDRNKRRRFRD